ncbi:MAG: archaemetzincin family Zn-dependent metalloprotease [Syntrophorhabdaceae bacterium]|nr:archaemetzincin family Zn-dependent metalloprotease [Syntrophorhabdaceae bacterium]
MIIYIALTAELEKRLWVKEIEESLVRDFGFPIRKLDLPISPESFYDKNRRQYHSTSILKEILNNTPENTLKMVGIVPFDLFIPILTFVFGEAQLNGKVAVVSTARLEQGYYGLPQNHLLLHRRLIKEIKHELGHTFGLLHCKDRACVMALANNIIDVDKKSLNFCTACLNLLHSMIDKIKKNSAK